jgi:hypothetical protein
MRPLLLHRSSPAQAPSHRRTGMERRVAQPDPVLGPARQPGYCPLM